MKLISISNLKKNAANLELEEPKLVTQNGVPVMVIQSYESYLSNKREIEDLVKHVNRVYNVLT